MKGKLYVIDGLDGCGKSTQAEMTRQKLTEFGYRVRLISFPDYEEDSSALVRMYLNGDFGKDANDVNAYAASTFYAVDRYASYRRHWKADYENGTVILASRYVSSNVLHQMGKLNRSLWPSFLNWLDDFEYGKLGLPRPDRVLFLEMARAVADGLILARYQGNAAKKDIHENNRAYLLRCQEAAEYAVQNEGWQKIICSDAHAPFAPEEINRKIVQCILTDLRV